MDAWQRVLDTARPAWREFHADLARARAVQERLLRGILSDNANTQFGRAHDFADIRDITDFQARVPIQDYAALEPEIMRMAQGESNVLCAHPVCWFEETGGSSGARKLIPYTEAGLAGFRAAVIPWLADLIQQRPGLTRGKAYWAISPVARRVHTTPAGMAIGARDDSAYFGAEIGSTLLELSAVSTALARITDMDEWRYLSAYQLCSTPELTLLSVWSPSFLHVLLDAIRVHGARIAHDLQHGTCGFPLSATGWTILGDGRVDRQAADRLRAALAQPTLETPLLWPQLDTISCWTDGSAAAYLANVRRHFPQVWIQGKGLLSTEAAISIPLGQYPAPVTALHSAFLEFVNEAGTVHTVDSVASGCAYRVIVTTASGLYRYDTGDRVRVRGHAKSAPMFEFIGRAGMGCDLCGEKLTQEFVLSRLPARRGFSLLSPRPDSGSGYVLYLDAADYDAPEAQRLAADLDRALCDNPQYAYARRLGQLREIEARRMQRPLAAYLTHCYSAGQRLGDIKPPVLSAQADWDTIFTPAENYEPL